MGKQLGFERTRCECHCNMGEEVSCPPPPKPRLSRCSLPAPCHYLHPSTLGPVPSLDSAIPAFLPRPCQPVLSGAALQPLGCSRTAQLLLGSLCSPTLYHLCLAPAVQAPKQGQLMHRGWGSPAVSWVQPQDAEQACGQFSPPHRASPRARMGFPVYLRRPKASPRASVEHVSQPHVDSVRHQPWQPMALPRSS